MTYGDYKKRILRYKKKAGLINKKHIQAHISESHDEPLIITSTQSIKKEELVFRNQSEIESDKSFQELVLIKLNELTKEIINMKNEIVKLKNRSNSQQTDPNDLTLTQSDPELLEEDLLPNESFDDSVIVPMSKMELPLNLPVPLPISNEIDLSVMIEWIKEEENRNVLALALIIDGTFTDVGDKVRTTLRKLMTRNMATLFNWEGRMRVNGPKKSSFLKTGLWVSVFMAINNTEDIDENYAADFAKQWFKGANCKPKH